MSNVKFKVIENNQLGTHSFYAVPVATGKLSFDDICEEASDGKSVTPATMRMCVSEYMKACRRELIRGFRVPLGEEFLTLYPNIRATAKDVVDKDGKVVKKAMADMVKVSTGISKIGCSVSPKFSDEFAANVSWQRVDAATGVAIDTKDDVTDDNSGITTGGSSDSGGSTSGTGTEKEG